MSRSATYRGGFWTGAAKRLDLPFERPLGGKWLDMAGLGLCNK